MSMKIVSKEGKSLIGISLVSNTLWTDTLFTLFLLIMPYDVKLIIITVKINDSDLSCFKVYFLVKVIIKIADIFRVPHSDPDFMYPWGYRYFLIGKCCPVTCQACRVVDPG